MASDLTNETTGLEVPELQAGDRLTRDEFERRYFAMPDLKKAELIEGVVYTASPVSSSKHGVPHARLVAWLINYEAATTGVEVADNATVRLDWQNEPQPDGFLRILPQHGRQTRDDGDYIAGAPELACEIAASSASYDLHDKKQAYLRNGVKEYLVWRVKQQAIDWFIHQGGEYVPNAPREDGVLCSQTFPGLWLDPKAMIAGDLKQVFAVLNEGLSTAEHREFARQLSTNE